MLAVNNFNSATQSFLSESYILIFIKSVANNKSSQYSFSFIYLNPMLSLWIKSFMLSAYSVSLTNAPIDVPLFYNLLR